VHWPARSTVCDLLSRHGMVERKRRRRYPGHPGKPSAQMEAPNDTWCADFKGESRPATASTAIRSPSPTARAATCSGVSRFLLLRTRPLKPVFRRLFQEYGLPQRIRRQRRSLRNHGDWKAQPALDPVDPPRNPPRADRAGSPPAERPPRADAQDPQAADDTSSCRHRAQPAAPLRPLSQGVNEERPTRRSARRRRPRTTRPRPRLSPRSSRRSNTLRTSRSGS
jgi:hypothetical protein